MTLIVASIAVESALEVNDAIERASQSVRAGAHLIEWRIDQLAEEDQAVAVTRRLVRASKVPSIVTCRTAAEGGDYHGDEQSRISLFEALATSAAPEERPRYIDLEWSALRSSANLRHKALLAVEHPGQVRDVQTGLIVSSHDFESRPADLLQRIESMTGNPACRIIKVAWMARSLRDNLEAFELLSTRRKPMVALCMGPFGMMSRVLAPKFGGLLTYASHRADDSTAPGQPTIRELSQLYRFHRITPKTKVYGVIGWPIEHSRSPQIHNAGFEAIDFDGVYLPLPIPPEYEHFKATVGALIDFAGLDFRGASVTMPHKEHALRFTLERGGRTDGHSETLGAANTLVIGSAGAVTCLNSDWIGAAQALSEALNLPRDDQSLKGARAAVLGAGGVAAAVVKALTTMGAAVTVFSRNVDRAKRLAQALHGTPSSHSTTADVSAAAWEQRGRERFDIIANCTPIGMSGGPAPDVSPLPEAAPVDERTIVFETVYAPARTPLVRQAEARDARVVTGGAMFMKQAAVQFEWWTGKAPPPSFFEAVESDQSA